MPTEMTTHLLCFYGMLVALSRPNSGTTTRLTSHNLHITSTAVSDREFATAFHLLIASVSSTDNYAIASATKLG
jgi:hypothetical protein